MHELLTQFGIDWKLLIAQIVNFTILVVVLRLFAYKPVLKILEERRKRIESGIQAAAESENRLAQIKSVEDERIRMAEERGLEIIRQAEEAAIAEEARLLKSAHDKAELVIASGQKRLEQDKEIMLEQVELEARSLVATGLAKVLKRMPAPERDEPLIDAVFTELKKLPRS